MLMKFGVATRLYYYTLGCNTVFRYDALEKAGTYRIMDAGDDLEVAIRIAGKERSFTTLTLPWASISDGMNNSVSGLPSLSGLIVLRAVFRKDSLIRGEYRKSKNPPVRL